MTNILKDEISEDFRKCSLISVHLHYCLELYRSGGCTYEEALKICIISLVEHTEELKTKYIDLRKNTPVDMFAKFYETGNNR